MTTDTSDIEFAGIGDIEARDGRTGEFIWTRPVIEGSPPLARQRGRTFIAPDDETGEEV